jgi:U3 small nucleolar RNA-associated protein 20
MSAAYHTTQHHKRGNSAYYQTILQPNRNHDSATAPSSNSSKRYRFQGFSERIANISIDSLFRSIQHVAADEKKAAADLTSASHFLTQFYKCRELDSSAHFNQFSKQIQPLIQSFPLVLLNKNKIINIILAGLQVENTLALPSLLQLLPVLAKDLRHEIYPQFPSITMTLLELISNYLTDSTSLELIFTSIMFLFKFLLKQLVQDIEYIYHNFYKQILQHRKVYIRRFAAESFAYLLRKLKNNQLAAVIPGILTLHDAEKPYFSVIIPADQQEPQNLTVSGRNLELYRDGVAFLFFEMLKNVNFSFHSIINPALSLLLNALHYTALQQIPSNQRENEFSHRFSIISTLFRRLCNHCRADSGAETVVSLLNEQIKLRIGEINSILASSSVNNSKITVISAELAQYFELFTAWITFRSGSRVVDINPIIKTAELALEPLIYTHPALDKQYFVRFFNFLAEIINCRAFSRNSGLFSKAVTLIEQLFALETSEVLLFVPFLSLIQANQQLKNIVSKQIINYSSQFLEKNPENSSDVLNLLLESTQNLYQHDEFHYHQQSIMLPQLKNQFLTQLFKFPANLQHFLVTFLVEKFYNFMNNGAVQQPERFFAALQLISVAGIKVSADLIPFLTSKQQKKWLLQQNKANSINIIEILQLIGLNLVGNSEEIQFLQCRALISQHILLLQAGDSEKNRFSSLLRAQFNNFLTDLAVKSREIAFLRSFLSFLQLLHAISADLSADFPSEIFSTSQFAHISSFLGPNLAHSNEILRILSISLLAQWPPLQFVVNSTGDARSELFGACNLIEIMQATLNLQGNLENEKELERNLKKIEVFAQSRRLPAEYTAILPEFVLGLFEIPLSSLWPHAQSSLALLASLFPTILWPKFIEKLKESTENTKIVEENPELPMEEGDLEENQPEISEESVEIEQNEGEEEENDEIVGGESLYSDLSAAFLSWRVYSVRSTDKFTLDNALWKSLTLEKFKVLANQRGDELIQPFLSWLRDEYWVIFPDKSPVGTKTALLEPSSGISIRPGGRKLAKVKLMNFLRYFIASVGNFSLISAENRAELEGLFFDWLLDSDPEIQSLALDCLARYNLPYLGPYKARLQRLIGETSFREEMTNFQLNSEGSIIAPQHRMHTAALIIRALYPKLIARKLTKSKSTLQTRRAAILAYLAGLNTEELQHLLVISVKPFLHILNVAAGSENQQTLAKTSAKKGKTPAKHEIGAALGQELPRTGPNWSLERAVSYNFDYSVPVAKQLGFLKLLDFMLKQLRSVIQPFLPQIATILLHLLQNSNRIIEKEGLTGENEGELEAQPITEEEAEEDAQVDENFEFLRRKELKQLRDVRQLIYTRFASMIDDYSGLFSGELRDYLQLYLKITLPATEKLSLQGTQHRGGLIESFVAASKHTLLLPVVYLEPRYHLLPLIFKIFAAKNVHKAVIGAVLEILENLLDQLELGEQLKLENIKASAAASEKSINLIKSNGTRISTDIYSSDEEMAGGSDSSSEEELRKMRGKKGQKARNPVFQPVELTAEEKQHRELLINVSSPLKLLISGQTAALLSSITVYISSLSSANLSNSNTNFQLKVFPAREFDLISKFSPFVTESSSAQQLMQLLQPFLQAADKNIDLNAFNPANLARNQAGNSAPIPKRRLPSKEQIKFNILSIMRAVVHLIPEPSAFISFFSRQFFTLQTLRNRHLAAQIFQELIRGVSSLSPTAKLLLQLNSVTSSAQRSKIDEIDYEGRLAGYKEFESKAASLGEKQLLALSYQFLHDLYEEELALRSNAVNALSIIISRTPAPQQQGGEDAMQEESSGSRTVPHLISTVIFPALKKGKF